jgi:hypothetical protein
MRRTTLLLIALTTALPENVGAQTDPRTVQDILGSLVTLPGAGTEDFDKDREAAEATRATLTSALLSAISQLPISASSSGFTYRLNPTLGTAERASDTFGPFFVERALTSGEGQASFGVTFQYASFSSLDGHDLREGDFVTIANRFRDEPEPFDVETLTLSIATRTTTAFGSVGVTDRLDVAAAVPVVALNISGSRINTYRGTSAVRVRGSAETFGFADIAVRTKYRFTPDGPANGAAAVELRLPTGRDQDLLGTGKTAIRFMGIGSADAGRVSVHGNLTLGMGGLGREWSYAGAVGVAATPRLTLVGEVLARHSTSAQHIGEVFAPHPRIGEVDTMRLMPTGDTQLLGVAVAGFKWNVSGTWLLHGNVLLPIGERGLTARYTPMIALDYSFTH